MSNPETKQRPISIAMKRLPHGTHIDLPFYASSGAAGMDICAAIKGKLTLEPGKRYAVPCGFAIAVPASTALSTSSSPASFSCFFG